MQPLMAAPARGAFPHNPNGSVDDIAGICDPTGRIAGLMPHPEAFNHVTNHPDWTVWKEQCRREGKTLPEEGLGIRLFRNAVEFFLLIHEVTRRDTKKEFIQVFLRVNSCVFVDEFFQ